MEWKTLATLALGLAAAIVGALLPQTSTICAAIAGACLGAVFPAVRTWGGNPKSRADDTPTLKGPVCILVLVLGITLFAPSRALANEIEDGWTPTDAPVEIVPTPQLGGKSGNWTWQPSTAMGLQLNLKTNDYERLALAFGYGITYHGKIHIGVAAFLGAGISKNNPNAAQGSLMLTLFDAIAIGPGVQVYKSRVTGERIWQGLLTVAWNLTNGTTLSGLGDFIREAGLF